MKFTLIFFTLFFLFNVAGCNSSDPDNSLNSVSGQNSKPFDSSPQKPETQPETAIDSGSDIPADLGGTNVSPPSSP